MSTIAPQVISTLGDAMQAMAPYAGGAVPAESDEQYANWIRWIQLGQQDAANRAFWRRLLVPKTITITADAENVTLPADFAKINGIYALFVNEVDWAAPSNEAGQRLYVHKHQTNGAWVARFQGFKPTETVTDATLWYFFNPPLPVNLSDPLFLDGEMIMFYALKEYFRKARQPGSLDDARIEYENRREELANLEQIPSRQELQTFMPYHRYLNQPSSERHFYGGRHNRIRR